MKTVRMMNLEVREYSYSQGKHLSFPSRVFYTLAHLVEQVPGMTV